MLALEGLNKLKCDRKSMGFINHENTRELVVSMQSDKKTYQVFLVK